jgi:hypothetical protein
MPGKPFLWPQACDAGRHSVSKYIISIISVSCRWQYHIVSYCIISIISVSLCVT